MTTLPRQQQAPYRESLADTNPSDGEVRQLTLRLPPVLHLTLTELAEEREISLNKLIIQACEQIMTLPGGAAAISQERRSLIAQGDHGEQAWAAIAYLLSYLGDPRDAARAWPWTQQFPGLGGAPDLIKAGGLVAAEIDRWQQGQPQPS